MMPPKKHSNFELEGKNSDIRTGWLSSVLNVISQFVPTSILSLVRDRIYPRHMSDGTCPIFVRTIGIDGPCSWVVYTKVPRLNSVSHRHAVLAFMTLVSYICRSSKKGPVRYHASCSVCVDSYGKYIPSTQSKELGCSCDVTHVFSVGVDGM